MQYYAIFAENHLNYENRICYMVSIISYKKGPGTRENIITL